MSADNPSASVPQPSDEAPDPPGAEARTGLLRWAPVVASVAVVVALVGVVLLLLPVSTPARDCGTSLTYLLDARYDIPIDPAAPPNGVTKAEAEAYNARPCHPRVVDRARPAAQAITVGVVAAVAALAAEILARNSRRRRRRSRLVATTSPS